MGVKFDDVHDAYMFVSASHLSDNQAFISKSTGQIFFRHDDNELDDVPDDIDENDDYIEVPSQNDLNLGKRLALDFATFHMSDDDLDEVLNIFSRRGAYQKYKSFLIRRNMLDQWYEYENRHVIQTLRQWCVTIGIELID
ncbi:MAG: hypothetical protein ACF8OB_10030 [Phycisphaeraceae bacterium JB051]